MARTKLVDTSHVWVKTQIEGLSRAEYAKRENVTKQTVDYHIKKMKQIIDKTK
jgi:predicted DNA-binding protein YlxM (UPF0122 family)